MRNPLHGLIGVIHQLNQTHLDQTQKLWIKDIDNCAQIMCNVVNDIVDLNKFEQGEFFINNTTFSISEIINSVKRATIPSPQNEQLIIRVNISDSIPTMLIGDPLRLKQILLNLVLNCMKFTRIGVITIQAELDSFLEHNLNEVLVKFSVFDSGSQITLQELEKLKKFIYNEHSLLKKTNYNEAGLGLYICQQLLKLLNAKPLEISEDNNGTCFSFKLSFNKILHTHKNEKESIKINKFILNHRILLVDDDPINLKIGKKLLESLGCYCDIAKDGIEAVKFVSENHYDAIFMDIFMPM